MFHAILDKFQNALGGLYYGVDATRDAVKRLAGTEVARTANLAENTKFHYRKNAESSSRDL